MIKTFFMNGKILVGCIILNEDFPTCINFLLLGNK